MLNDTEVQLTTSQKHLGLTLDSKLDFNERIDNKINKCNKIKCNKKTFLNPVKKNLANNMQILRLVGLRQVDLDYTDMIYDKPFNESFKRKIEMVQYKAALVIIGATKKTSRDRLYQEFALESLADRRWSSFSSKKIYRDSYNLIFKFTVMLLVKERI